MPKCIVAILTSVKKCCIFFNSTTKNLYKWGKRGYLNLFTQKKKKLQFTHK